jgi:hypothetical protein
VASLFTNLTDHLRQLLGRLTDRRPLTLPTVSFSSLGIFAPLLALRALGIQISLPTPVVIGLVAVGAFIIYLLTLIKKAND